MKLDCRFVGARGIAVTSLSANAAAQFTNVGSTNAGSAKAATAGAMASPGHYG